MRVQVRQASWNARPAAWSATHAHTHTDNHTLAHPLSCARGVDAIMRVRCECNNVGHDLRCGAMRCALTLVDMRHACRLNDCMPSDSLPAHTLRPVVTDVSVWVKEGGACLAGAVWKRLSQLNGKRISLSTHGGHAAACPRCVICDSLPHACGASLHQQRAQSLLHL